ncbi:protein rep, partial [Streptomyces phaeochromogenes]
DVLRKAASRRVSPAPWAEGRRGAGAAPGGPAGGQSTYYANNVSPDEEKTGPDQAKEVWQERRGKRFAQRVVLRRISTLPRVQKCGLVTNGNEGNGSAAIVVNEGHASWSGYCSCGSIWACPVCAAKIRLVRADEIARAVAKHMIEDGGTAWMVTLTARHKKYHDLAPVLDAVANGWRRLMSGKAWAGDKKTGLLGEKDKLGIRGYIRSLEVTWGHRNGFHPHLHVVVLMNNETTEELAYMMGRWWKTWRAWMKKHGYEPTEKHGIVWSKVTTPQEAGEYIAKLQEGRGLGNEIARGDMKSGSLKTLAPFELLEYFRLTGDMDVIPVWRQYEQGTFNRRAITWSRGLRPELLPKEVEKTDEEVVNDKVAGERWAVLPAESLKRMRQTPGLETQLLDAAENGGFAELVNLLTAYHLEFEVGPDAPSEEDDGSSDVDEESALA